MTPSESDEVDARDLAADELQELLESEQAAISADQAAGLAKLIASAGSVERAIAALAELAKDARAA